MSHTIDTGKAKCVCGAELNDHPLISNHRNTNGVVFFSRGRSAVLGSTCTGWAPAPSPSGDAGGTKLAEPDREAMDG